MNILRYLPSSSALALSFVCTAQGAIHQAPLASETIEPLFVHALGVPLEVDEDRPEIVTIGAIHLRTDLLVNGAQNQSGRFSFELFDGEPHVVVFKKSFHSLTGSWIWQGSIEGNEGGDLIVAVNGDSAFGILEVDDDRYTIEPEQVAQGFHSLIKVDSNELGECGVEAGERSLQSTTGNQFSTSPSGPSIADVLVVFLPEVGVAMGGVGGVTALADVFVAQANQVYEQSEIDLMIRLVGVEETLQGSNGDLESMVRNLQDVNDGWYDEVHSIRDAVGADFVSLIANGGLSSPCGWGFIMDDVNSPSFDLGTADRWGFSAVRRNCTNYIFAHELGHNMGCDHDRDNTTGFHAYPYSRGYRTPGDEYRTVMAYLPGNRIGYFSNPDISYQGFSLGVAAPSSNSADNARTIAETAPIFSQFRCGAPESYGYSMITSQGNELSLEWIGTPMADGSGSFNVFVRNGVPNQFGLLFYGGHPSDTPFMGGNRYVGFPIIRMPVVQVTVGGMAFFDWMGHAQPIPGDDYYLQFWQRDPNNFSGFNVALSNGLRIDPCN